ncbi:OLC1v1031934C1 [Oldenlandia corymbosa var. corymbosa]|uniref:OLC1v1031934C1 n=1 Tax=Oldenlandia corymbosa var. corymbosa TaxID=529605 RepID=A0AAV1CJJ5_OLDCO|nr:OLC1v1031934C1 [Oldenlandia corymbosa var. corymbosa]
MATWWMKSLQCKSKALDDVVQHKQKLRSSSGNSNTTPKSQSTHHHHNIIPNSASCRKSVQSLKDVVETAKHGKPRKPNKSSSSSLSLSSPAESASPTTPLMQQTPLSRRGSVSRKSGPVFPSSLQQQPGQRVRPNGTRISRSAESFFPALTELPQGHPSRNVVEIIFHSSWSSPKVFSGRIEMVFKVQNLPRTVTRFEEYREAVKSRPDSGEVIGLASSEEEGGEEDARCVADGNEVMRFYCLGPTTSASSGGAYDPSGCAWAFSGAKGSAICTFSGSGAAHESAGGGRGRRAMLVCRVIAGRVCKQIGYDSVVDGKKCGYDSVSGENNELLVFDSRAVLPCFLIIYKL